MKKICFLVGDISKTGGTERVTTIIANELSESNEVTILSLTNGKESFFKLKKGVKVESLEIKNPKNIINIILVLRRYIKENHFDCLIEVDSILRIFTLLAVYRLNVKIVTWEHFNFYLPNLKKRILAHKLAAKFSDCIITLTEEDMEYYKKEVNIKNKIQYIYNPSPFVVKEDIFKNRTQTAIAVGRLSKQKNFMRLLEIWKIIEQQNWEWNLNIIGSGEEEERLIKYIKDNHLQRVSLLGNIKDMESVYKQSDLILMTSDYEGLPMCLIEAQSFGIPIVSYDIPTGPKDIIDNGKNGFLIKNNDKNDFINKTLLLMNNKELLDEMTQNSFRNAYKFNEKNIKQKWEKIIEEIF